MVAASIGMFVFIFLREEYLVAFCLGFATSSWLVWMSGEAEELIRQQFKE
jgi:hypothetical protein